MKDFIKDIENAKEIRGKYDIETFKKHGQICKEIANRKGYIGCPDWVIDLYYSIGGILENWLKVGGPMDYDAFGSFSRRYVSAMNDYEKIVKDHKEMFV